LGGEFIIKLDSWVDITVRLVFAVLVGGLIGLDREARSKAGGLRTHMLVSLGSALFVIIPLQMQTPLSIDALSRVIQGVATGIGFLGAGEIIHQSGSKQGKWKVKGLTSAAAIWLTAVLGLAAGCGLLPLCLIGTVLGLIILVVAKRFERIIPMIPAEPGDHNHHNPSPPA
jgi:putative Mg2+ transporter-C (MgtC) family protein